MGWISRIIPKWLRAQPSETIRPEMPKPYGSNNNLNAPSQPSRASLPIQPGPILQGGNVGSTASIVDNPSWPQKGN